MTLHAKIYDFLVSVAGPLPSIWAFPLLFRTIFLRNILAIFTVCGQGYKKISEGISEKGYEDIRKIWVEGGIWVWLCSSVSTEKSKKSYVYGVVFISHIVETNKFKKQYKLRALKPTFRESKNYPWQAIIQNHKYARIQLKKPIQLLPTTCKKTGKYEQRVKGVWKPIANQCLLSKLQQAISREVL